MSKQEKKPKIAIVGYKLAQGGQERVFSTVSMLLDDASCDVHVIVLEDAIEYPSGGTLVNLGLHSKFRKYFQLKKYLKANQFDLVIDFRYRLNPFMELLFLHYIYAGFSTIYTIHSSKLELYFTKSQYVTNQIFKKVKTIVSVSTAMNEKIIHTYQFHTGVVIPNSISGNTAISADTDVQLHYKYCIALGRLVALKQFDKLIETYCQSDLPEKEIHLVILGEGEEKIRLQEQITNTKNADFIHLLGFKENTSEFVKNSEFVVLTSQYEGFPMVILEALSFGTPVISFDCETGPSEMIVNKFNGLLVENQNFEALKKALNRMTADKELYEFCKKNTTNSVAKFSEKKIQKKWLDLLNINTNYNEY